MRNDLGWVAFTRVAGAAAFLAFAGPVWANERIDALFAKAFPPGGPGGICVVIKDGKLIHQGCYGLADIERGTAFDLDQAFDLASLSKQFTGLALAMLVADGTVDLDGDVREYLPELPVHDADRPIRVRDLAHMVSGLASYQDLLDDLAGKTNDDVLAAVAKADLAFPTGSKYEYSNTDYNLLATLVARAAKAADFGSVARARIFRPLGLERTAVQMAADQEIPRRIRGYKRSDGPSPWTRDTDDTPGIVGDGSVFSTARDLIRYESAIRDGEIPAAAAKVWMTTGPRAPEEGARYALGWQLDELDGHERRQHSGAWNGTSTFMAMYDAPALTVIVLLNADDGDAEGLGDEVARVYLPGKGE